MIFFSLWFWLWCAFYNRSLKKHIILFSKCTSRLPNKGIHIKLISSVRRRLEKIHEQYSLQLCINAHFQNLIIIIFLQFHIVPVIVCPSITKNESGSISFESPMLKNFPNPERVFIIYSNGVALPASIPVHELHDFQVGSTHLTAMASDGDIHASCDLHYYRLPGMLISALFSIQHVQRISLCIFYPFEVSNQRY